MRQLRTMSAPLILGLCLVFFGESSPAYEPKPYVPSEATKTRATPPPPSSPKPTPPAKSQFNTNIYEKSDDNQKFTDVVKVVRDLDGNQEVLFMKKGGVFQAPVDQGAAAKLIESQIHKTPVTVTVNDDTKKILSVISAAKAAGK